MVVHGRFGEKDTVRLMLLVRLASVVCVVQYASTDRSALLMSRATCMPCSLPASLTL